MDGVLDPAGAEQPTSGDEPYPWTRSASSPRVRSGCDLGDTDLDPHLLMWDVRGNVDLDAVPAARTVLRFTFTDVSGRPRDWWLVISPAGVDICDLDLDHPLAATVETDLRTLTLIWRGDLDWATALRSGALALHGPAPITRALPRWLTLSSFAGVPRPARVG